VPVGATPVGNLGIGEDWPTYYAARAAHDERRVHRHRARSPLRLDRAG